MKRLHWSFSVIILLALVLGACAQPTATDSEQVPVVQQDTQVAPVEEVQPSAEKKVATFIFTQEFDSLNPHYTNMWFSQITQQLWNCWAWQYDDQNAPYPLLVAEMPSGDNGGISTDGKVITLNLRDDIVWSDGTPMTSTDFKFTYEMAIDPNNTVASSYPYSEIEKIETPDEQTVIITFKEPFAPWMGTLWKGMLPAHVLQPVYDSAGNINEAEWNRLPSVGCGPYVFETWESGSFARLVANDNYWLGRPKIDEIFIRFVPDDASQIAALLAGEGDLGTFFAYSDVPDLENAGVEVIKVFSGYNEGIYFYLDPENGHPALQDVRVRQAIAMAFDRFSLNEDLLLGMTEPAMTDWDNTPYIDPSLEPWPFDPEKSKQLLDEAGWIDSNGDGVREKDGVDLVLKFGTTTREIRVDTQAVVQQQLADVGIKVDLFNYDSDIFFSGYADGGPAASGDLDMFEYSGVPNFPDPDISEWRCAEIPTDENPEGINWMALCDEELDALFKKQATQVDFAERQQTFHQITKYIFENVYWLGVWQDPDLFGVNERLTNVKLSGATPFFNIIEWDIQQ